MNIAEMSRDELVRLVAEKSDKTTAVDNLIIKKEQFLAETESYKKSLIFEYVTGKKEVL